MFQLAGQFLAVVVVGRVVLEGLDVVVESGGALVGLDAVSLAVDGDSAQQPDEGGLRSRLSRNALDLLASVLVVHVDRQG